MSELKVKVKQNYLAQALNLVGKGLQKDDRRPVLQYIHLNVTKKDGIVFSTSDGDALFQYTLNENFVEVEKEGIILVKGSEFVQFTQIFPSESIIDIEYISKNHVLKLGAVKEGTKKEKTVKILCKDEASIDDFPLSDFSFEKDKKCELSINLEKFKAMINKTTIAIPSDEEKDELMGAKFIIKDGNLDGYATDRVQICRDRFTVDDNKKDFSFVLPASYLFDIVRFLPSIDEVTISRQKNTGNLFSMRCGHIYIVSRTKEDKFDDLEIIISKQTAPYSIEFNRDELNNIVKGLLIAESDVAIFTYNKNNDNFIIKSATVDRKTSFALTDDTIDIKSNDNLPDNMTFALQPIFLQRRLMADKNGGNVIIQAYDCNSKLAPLFIKSENDSEFIYLCNVVQLKNIVIPDIDDNKNKEIEENNENDEVTQEEIDNMDIVNDDEDDDILVTEDNDEECLINENEEDLSQLLDEL